jgi:O-antigen/teichoic acid export membrane protein
MVGLGSLGGGSSSLILATTLGEFLASLNLGRVVFRAFRELYRGIEWKRMWRLAKEYRDFPIYSASMNIINSLSLGLPIFLLTRYYGIAVAGAYAFGLRILSTPMGFVLRALRQVLFQKASEAHNAGSRLMPLYVKITAGLFALAVLPSLVFIFWSPQIFSWVFGAQWSTAGEFTRSLVLWMLFMFCNVPAILFAQILRMQRKMFIFNFIVLASRAVILVIGGNLLSASWTIFLFSLVGAILNIIYIVIIGLALKAKEDDKDLPGMIKGLKEE